MLLHGFEFSEVKPKALSAVKAKGYKTKYKPNQHFLFPSHRMQVGEPVFCRYAHTMLTGHIAVYRLTIVPIACTHSMLARARLWRRPLSSNFEQINRTSWFK